VKVAITVLVDHAESVREAENWLSDVLIRNRERADDTGEGASGMLPHCIVESHVVVEVEDHG
jgi:hypothetical protein